MIELLKKFPLLGRLARLPFLSRAYHYSLSFLGALRYGFPSRRLIVIGVTGTKGKTTTAHLLAQLLQSSGRPAGLATTVLFRIGDREWVNATKQTMPGRFALQGLLRRMVREGCRYAVVETSSEGILQFRHRFIDYRAAIFTNLSPEHIERHGSFENYREAKVRLFARTARHRDGIGIYNLDDANADKFLAPPLRRKFGFGRDAAQAKKVHEFFGIEDVRLAPDRTEFSLGGERYRMPLVGGFNVYNAAAALVAALALGVSVPEARSALASAKPAPGRLELVRAGQPFTVIVDYAHEPASLTALYEAAKIFSPRRVIGILGSQGGGRDVWKRAAMGEIAARYCDELILTGEDPYDEDPERIMDDIEKGTRDGKANVRRLADRGEAIRTALSLAEEGDAVVLSGKGGEVSMCVKGGTIPWSDREVAEDFFKTRKASCVQLALNTVPRRAPLSGCGGAPGRSRRRPRPR